MKIKRITDQLRNDFSADMECEHCGHVQHISSGYDDAFYHLKVIPAMTCKSCGKNRSGEVPVISNDHGILHVKN